MTHRESCEVKFKKGRRSFTRTAQLLITPSTPQPIAITMWAEENSIEHDSFVVKSTKELEWYGDD